MLATSLLHNRLNVVAFKPRAIGEAVAHQAMALMVARCGPGCSLDLVRIVGKSFEVSHRLSVVIGEVDRFWLGPHGLLGVIAQALCEGLAIGSRVLLLCCCGQGQ
jgi:hypothetical protein